MQRSGAPPNSPRASKVGSPKYSFGVGSGGGTGEEENGNEENANGSDIDDIIEGRLRPGTPNVCWASDGFNGNKMVDVNLTDEQNSGEHFGQQQQVLGEERQQENFLTCFTYNNEERNKITVQCGEARVDALDLRRCVDLTMRECHHVTKAELALNEHTTGMSSHTTDIETRNVVLVFLRHTFTSDDSFWLKEGRRAINSILEETQNDNVAKNIILFIGDGLGITVSTAARIYKGQKRGFVTTSRVTHATPAALYARSPSRAWECDTSIPKNFTLCKDIARQLIEDRPGIDINVIMGGGRQQFLDYVSPSERDYSCSRADGRNLIAYWADEKWERNASFAYVQNTEELLTTDLRNAEYLLGLFNNGHMATETNRDASMKGQPHLSVMTSKAIQLLSQGQNGYFLMVWTP
ncbi:unnamed protein product [Notodromas monacha]|uniref:alkaline phosphatase n=1 Tax=Notodromas monacha TaxID=399045 RepID=A0A7R9G8W8_9CRUS|nr:unnamed protein product [Notodromas monacha]CAG0912214.1 unnamed protein product [Notodromas monacha]